MTRDRIGNFIWHREFHDGSTCRYGIATHVDEGAIIGAFVVAVFHPSFVWDPPVLAGLETVLAARAAFQHPLVPRLVEYSVAAPDTKAPTYAVFDYVSGVSADVLERRAAETSRRLALVVAARITMEVARTVDEVATALGAEALDVDLGNVRVGWDGRVCLAFPPIIPNHGVGNVSTPSTSGMRHPSPEAISGEDVTKRSLVFQLGVMLYRLVESRHPYQGSSPMETFMRIVEDRPDPLLHPSPELDVIVSRALAREPERRYESPLALAKAIETSLSPAPTDMVGAEISALCPSERRAEYELMEDFGGDATLTDPIGGDDPTLVDEL